MDLKQLAAELTKRELDTDEISLVAAALAAPAPSGGAKEEFLLALSRRGETGAEIAGFATAFRALARDPGLERWAPVAIDVCGTGGDKAGTFNISTVVSFVLAVGGVPVIKHGNRSITSQSGSADLLEALGIRIDPEPTALARSLEELNFVFLFAPAFHPAFKEIAPVRKALAARGERTVFNVLGPLLNPGRPAHQVVGVFSAPFVAPIAEALHRLGLAAGYVVHGTAEGGRAFDELTVAGPNRAVGFGRLRAVDGALDAGDVGLSVGGADGLLGGDVRANIALLDRVLAGEAPPVLIDTIVLNAAAALHAVGRFATVREAVPEARALLLGGAVRSWLERARAFYRA